MKTPAIGSVSSGTLRPQDLLEAFASTLESLLETDQDKLDYKPLLDDVQIYRDMDDDGEAWESEADEISDLITTLEDTLSDLAPPYVIFGANEGDGADFGFWASLEALEMDVRAGEVAKVEGSIPSLLMHVNDHGNVTLYQIVEVKEVWSLV